MRRCKNLNGCEGPNFLIKTMNRESNSGKELVGSNPIPVQVGTDTKHSAQGRPKVLRGKRGSYVKPVQATSGTKKSDVSKAVEKYKKKELEILSVMNVVGDRTAGKATAKGVALVLDTAGPRPRGRHSGNTGDKETPSEKKLSILGVRSYGDLIEISDALAAALKSYQETKTWPDSVDVSGAFLTSVEDCIAISKDLGKDDQAPSMPAFGL